MARFVGSLEEISGRYAAVFCDVWGVVHNGVSGFSDAMVALAAAREKGIAVILITNAPRPADGVKTQLDSLGLHGAWDGIVTSGDVTRELIRNGPRQQFHLGPERDLSIFDGIDIELVEEREASIVVCTGLYDDENDEPSDYEEQLRRLRSRDLPMICANPDVVVERGDRLIWCAGALARDYAQRGGRTMIAGKPHRPIYEAASAAAAEVLGRPLPAAEVLAIGDGILTDVKGAAMYGIDVLYVSAGIHARDYGDPENPDTEMLGAFLGRHGHRPVAYIPKLR